MTDVLHLWLHRELLGVGTALLFGAGFGLLWTIWRWLFATKSRVWEALGDFCFVFLVGCGVLLHALSYMQGVLRLSSIVAGTAGFCLQHWIFLKIPFPFGRK